MSTFFFDTETHLIDREAGVLAPDLVCLQYAINEGAPRVLSARFDAVEIRDVLERALAGDVLVAHNGAFDFAVLAAWDETLLPGIFKALASGRRGRDTMLREQLIDIREGRFIGDDDKLEQKSLDELAQKYARMPLSKGALSWRTRYQELEDKPVACWPRPAIRYAEDDVVACRAVYRAQAKVYESPDEWLQVCAAFVLHLAAVHGIRTTKEKLEPLIAELETERAMTLQSLIRQGLWNAKEESVDQKALEAIIEKSCQEEGIEVPRTPTGKPKRDKKTMELLAHKLPDLKHYSEYQYVNKILSTYCVPMKRGLTVPLVSRPNALVGTGRTSWGEPNLQNFPRREGIRDCIVPRPGNVWLSVDYDSLEVRTFAQVLYWVTGESRAGDFYKEDPNWDPHTYMASRMIGIPYAEGLARKENDKFFKKGPRQRSKCFHPDVEFLSRRGWLRFDQLTDTDEIIQATPSVLGESPRLEYVKPFNLFKKQATNLIRLHNENIDLIVTDDHRMLAFGSTGKPKVVTPEEFSKQRGWWSAGVLEQSGDIEVDEAWLRLAVATQADGSFKGSRGKIRWGFSKKRKIERMRHLLSAAGLHANVYTYRPKNTRHAASVHFTLQDEEAIQKIKGLLTEEKEFPEWYRQLSLKCKQIVLDEVQHWDATHPTVNAAKCFHYLSTRKQNCEILQELAITVGWKANYIRETAGPNRVPCFSLTVKARDYTRGENVHTEIVAGEHEVVCLSVPSSFVLVRQNGKPVITGQCAVFGVPGGMGAEKFRLFSKAQYNVDMTLQESQELKDFYLNLFPEVNKYFRYIDYLCRNGLPAKQFVSQRLRGGLYFPACANTFFQGLAADGAKRALIRVSAECYCNPDSPLFGSRITAFIHDEICLEVPEEKAHDAAMEVVRLMEEEMSVVCPDVPIRATPALSRCWLKAAEPKYRDGKLIPHEDP